VQRTACSTILSAVAIATALGLGGCSAHHSADPAASVEEQTPGAQQSVSPPAPEIAPLPPPEALTDVMVKLADPDVPGAQKVGLVEYATPDDAAALDKFGHALRDSGYTPLSFEARDLNWAKDQAGNVTATIVVKTANPQSGDFTFPMEFSPSQGSWQLTRETADMLLALGQEPAPTPTR
jgi:hypothetical protein